MSPPRPAPTKPRTSFIVRLPVDLHLRLRDAAAREDRSMAQVIRRLVEAYVGHEEHEGAA